MELHTATTEQLREELEKRESSETDEQYILCIGLIDVDGAESLIQTPDAKKFETTLNSLLLRSRFNSHRSPIIYAIRLPKELISIINERFSKGEFQEIGNMIQSFSTFKKIG